MYSFGRLIASFIFNSTSLDAPSRRFNRARHHRLHFGGRTKPLLSMLRKHEIKVARTVHLPVSFRLFKMGRTVGHILGIVMSGLWIMDEKTAGVVFMVLIFLPSIAGTCVSCSAMSKQLGNHPLLWTSLIWNLGILLILVILSVIGNLKG